MRVQVVTPWYPDYASVYSGVFVQKQVEAVQALGATVAVEVLQIFPAPAMPVPGWVTDSMRTLASNDPDSIYASAEEATWIPAPVPSRSGYMGRARAFAESIRIKREYLPVSADLTHAHLGVPTGWAAARVWDGPLVVTEHQSTLADLFREPDVVEAYRATIERAEAFFCVSEHLRAQVIAAVGSDIAQKVEVLPNVVDLEDIPFTRRDQHEFRSWIYVGALVAHKGVQELLRAFRTYRKTVDGEARLTIVGDGTLRVWVERFVVSNGLRNAVTLAGAQPHKKIGRFLADADVMVHLSPSETFGIASLEGIGAGLPVISLRNGGADTAWGDYEAECGRLLELGATADSVAAAVAELKAHPESLDPAAGRAMVEMRFSPAVIGQRLLDTYRACLP